MENIKKNSATTIDYISSATMKKTGDQNVTAAVARVSGVSTSGGLITVRGMGDRYVKTTFNGSIIPTLDPLTNNIKLEMFPASLIDNIIFTKTASADLRGDWSGAYISVETKDYPEKLTVNVETQLGYNQQSTFKDVISSERSKTDWLGYDDGLREREQKHNQFNIPNIDPSGNIATTAYQEMLALGLGDYYKSLGVTNFDESSIYFNLGLVQLGILQPALINNQAAISAASLTYRTNYKPKAFKLLYPDGTDYNNQFANNWDSKKRKAPLNFSQSFGVGNQTLLFGKPLGYIFGFRYGASTRYDGNGSSNRIIYNDNNGIWGYTNKDHAEISRETNGWSALFNLSYKLNPQNTLSFLFMPNQTGVNDVVHFKSYILGDNGDDAYPNMKNLYYEQRKQNIYQFKSEHFIPATKIKIDFNLSYTKGKSNVPDFKSLPYEATLEGQITQLSPTAGDGIKRFYRYLSENIFDSRLSAELPISKPSKAGARKLKFGAGYEENNRKSENYGYLVNTGNLPNASNFNSISDILNTNNFIMQNGKIVYTYAPSLPDNNYALGMSIIKSAFVLVDYSIVSALRVSGGLRIEKTNIFTDVNKYYDKYQYVKNDFRIERDSGEINQLNFLPSINVIYKMLDNGKALINARFNASQTLARPSIRELSNYRIYDNEFRNGFVGNPKLKMAQIRNYDFRLESYFKNGDNVSISLFYKYIKNNIEMAFGSGEGITWINVDTTIVQGIEFEGKKNIIKNLEFRANVTLVKSQTKYTTNYGRFDRKMFGQAPYIINGMLVYSADSLGLTATVGYNVQGPKLVIVDLLPQNPFVYELPRHTIDVKISKTLGKHFSASVTVRDVLNAPIRREYRTQQGEKLNTNLDNLDFDRFRYGTNFILGVSYKI
jgi:hypothetical protein